MPSEATVLVENQANLSGDLFESLRAVLTQQTSMARAMPWFFSHSPKLAPVGMVTQDEFSYDLLVPYSWHGHSLHLSYSIS
jgi:hypothetical protein